MIDHLLRDLQVLRKADLLIGKIWLNALLRRLGLAAFAGLIAVFGLGMGNIAGFYALQTSLGAVWAAALVALIDLLIAGVVLLAARSAGPGPDLDLALEVRKIAVQSIQADASDLKLTLDAVVGEIRGAKATLSQLAHNPLDVAAQKLLIPAVLSILKGLHPK